MHADLASTLSTHLTEYGLEVRAPFSLEQLHEDHSQLAMVTHRRGRQRHLVRYMPTMTVSAMAPGEREHDEVEPLLVLGPRITERSADIFRRLGVNYLDQAGNAYIDFEGVHIDVRGRRSLLASQRSSASESRPANLFSTKRSQVVFAMLSWAELGGASLRAIAAASGVSLGQVRETLMLLEEAGYLDDERRLRRGSELLDRWAAAFPASIGAPSRQRTFFGDIDDLRAPDDVAIAISGESALPQQLRPETLTLYVSEFTGTIAAINRWRSDRAPNIFVRTRFWQDPLGEPMPGTVSVAPSALTYADLRSGGDGRLSEVADWMRQNDDRLREL